MNSTTYPKFNVWYVVPNESELKLGRVRIMLQIPLLLVPLENTNNIYWRKWYKKVQQIQKIQIFYSTFLWDKITLRQSIIYQQVSSIAFMSAWVIFAHFLCLAMFNPVKQQNVNVFTCGFIFQFHLNQMSVLKTPECMLVFAIANSIFYEHRELMKWNAWKALTNESLNSSCSNDLNGLNGFYRKLGWTSREL